jgi:hypothetical protein
MPHKITFNCQNGEFTISIQNGEFTRQLRNYIADTMLISRQWCDTYKNLESPQNLLIGYYDMFCRQLEEATTISLAGEM